MPEQTLQTDRLILRPVQQVDLDFFCRLYGDPVVMRYYDLGKPYDPGHIEAMVDYDIQRRQCTGYGSWVIIEKDSSEPIGHGGFERHAGLQVYMLYYLFRHEAWGKGYATEFARRAIEHGFADLGFEQIQATAHPQNTGSIRVLEKTGMRFVRYMPDLVRNLYAAQPPGADPLVAPP